MFKNYFTIAFRILWKNKIFSIISIFSLAIGLCSCLLLMKYINYQFSFDKYHEKSERIYRIPYVKTVDGEFHANTATNVGLLAPWLQENMPEIEEAIRITKMDEDKIFKYNDGTENGKAIEAKITWVDTNFFEMMDVEFIYGNQEYALKNRATLNISSSLSQKLFGNENPLGKKLRIWEGEEYEIVGVFKDIPKNSHLSFNMLMSYKQIANLSAFNDWKSPFCHTYVILNEGISKQQFQERLDEELKGDLGYKLLAWHGERWPDVDSYEDLQSKYDLILRFPLQSINSLNFSSYDKELKKNKDKRMIMFLLVIGIFILLIAWINYINLSSVKLFERAKEIGIREISGMNKFQLFTLIFFEILIINVISIILSLLLYQLVYPLFIGLAEISSCENPFQLFIKGIQVTFGFWMLISGLFLLGLIAPSIIPIIYINKLKVVELTKGKLIGKFGGGVNFRKIMIIVQFVFSIFMISSTITIYRQINYMNKMDLGFNLDQTLVIETPSLRLKGFFKKVTPFFEDLEKHPDIYEIISTNTVPGKSIPTFHINALGREKECELKHTRPIYFSDDYLDFFGIELLAGRNFYEDAWIDTGCLILNESATKLIGFPTPEEAVDEIVYFFYTQGRGSLKQFAHPKHVIGVVKDHHHAALKNEKMAMTFQKTPYKEYMPVYAIKFNPASTKEVLDYTKEKWSEHFEEYPFFNYFFLDDNFNKEYSEDKKFQTISSIFSFLSIFIACIGLYALSVYNTKRRTKEIGIRKINGASIKQIIYLFVKDFTKLVIVGYAICMPIAYYAMHKWLQNYPYKISLGVMFFVIPLILIIVISAFTIIIQVIKSARANPVDSLRYE